MFREFIYLDTDRVQSIIAQLQKGLLTEIMSGNQKEVSATAGVTKGVLSQVVGIEAGVQGKYGTDIRQSKVLHDFAFNIALDSLREKDLLIENVDEFKREEFPVPEAAFILTAGQAKLYDISILTRLWERKWHFGQGGKNRGLERKPHKKSSETDDTESSQARALFETFYGDAIIISQTNAQDVTFEGLLLRQHLREDIRSLIFKYGAKPQGTWSLLAQVGNIPEPSEALVNEENARGKEDIGEISLGNPENRLEAVMELIERSNEFQQQMGTVLFPKISISPIAVYRELSPLR